MTHPIPDDVLNDHLGVLAKTGAGKTYLAKGIIERLLKQKRRVCIVDPKNAYWGLKSSADGKSPGFPIVIFGGPNADVPLLSGHGKVLGEAVATSDLSCVICTKGMMDGDRIRFLTEFFQTLDMKNSEPLHLILDEAHMMAPQKPLGEMQRLTHWTSELVSGGRGNGFRVILLSQRPARLNKDVLTQCESLVAMRMTGPQDREAVKAWIVDQADADKGKEIIASLPSLPTGEGWFWAPTRDILKRVKFPQITTYDSSKTKKDGAADKRAELAPVDLAELEKRLGKVKAEIDANNPAALKKKIAELQKELADTRKQKAPSTAKASDADLTRIKSDGWNAGWAAAMKEVDKQRAVRNKAISAVNALLERAMAAMPPVETAATIQGGPAVLTTNPSIHRVPPKTAAAIVGLATAAVAKFRAETAPAAGLSRPQQKVLDAVAWWAAAGHDAPTRPQVAGVAGYSPSSGGFNNIIGSLNTMGLLTVPQAGRLALTGAGQKIAATPDTPTTEELHSRVRAILDNPKIKLFDVAVAAHPDSLTRAELAERTGYSAESGGFNNLIGALSILEIFVKPAPGHVRAADWLFL